MRQSELIEHFKNIGYEIAGELGDAIVMLKELGKQTRCGQLISKDGKIRHLTTLEINALRRKGEKI